MRKAITISLPEELKKELDRVIAKEGLTRSDIVRESLRKYLFTLEFKRLRARMVAKAQAKGVHTDRDVFDRVS